MTDIIYKMRGDLREILYQSVKDYPSKAREKWIFDWPSQIILVVNQIFWCQEVEEAFMNLNKGKSNALKVNSPYPEASHSLRLPTLCNRLPAIRRLHNNLCLQLLMSMLSPNQRSV